MKTTQPAPRLEQPAPAAYWLTVLRHAALLVPCALSVLAVSAQPARADMDDLMTDIFGMYINATPVGILETQRRGGITMGSVTMRNRVIRPNIINFQPPSIRGGCGGIDAYGGSFSFINSAQLNALLQAIASNALSYAFTLALEGVCPTCMQKIEKLRDWMNDMNKYLQDSCQAGKALVNATGLDDWVESRKTDAQLKDTNAGVFSDFFQALDQFSTNLASDAARGVSTQQNVVWEALRENNTAGGWFGAFSDRELSEALMSVTGTVIYSSTTTTGLQCVDTNGDQEYCIEVLPPLLTMDQFVNGALGGGTVNVYRCDGIAVQCLRPAIANASGWRGFREIVKEILFGPAPAYVGGLIYKLRDGSPAPTASERAFMEGAPVSVRTLLIAAADSFGTMHTMGQRMEAVIANQSSQILVSESILAIKRAVENEDDMVARGRMSELLKDRLEEFKIRKTVWDKELEDVHRLYATTAIITKAARGAKQGDQPLEGGTSRTQQ